MIRHQITHVTTRDAWDRPNPERLNEYMLIRVSNGIGEMKVIRLRELLQPGDVVVHAYDGEILKVNAAGELEPGDMIDLSGSWGVAIAEGTEDVRHLGGIGGGSPPPGFFNVVAKRSLS